MRKSRFTEREIIGMIEVDLSRLVPPQVPVGATCRSKATGFFQPPFGRLLFDMGQCRQIRSLPATGRTAAECTPRPCEIRQSFHIP